MKKVFQNSMMIVLFVVATVSATAIYAADLPANPCDKDGCTTVPGSNNGTCVRSAGGEKWCCVSPVGDVKDCYSEQ